MFNADASVQQSDKPSLLRECICSCSCKEQVFQTGVDEFLAVCKYFDRLSKLYPDDWEPPPHFESDMTSSDDDVSLEAGDYEVEAVRHILA